MMAHQMFSNPTTIKSDVTEIGMKLYGKKYRSADGTIRNGKIVDVNRYEEVVKVEIIQNNQIVGELPFKVERSNRIIATLDLNQIPLEVGYFEILVTTKKKKTSAFIISKGRFNNKIAPKVNQSKKEPISHQSISHESMIAELNKKLLEGEIDG